MLKLPQAIKTALESLRPAAATLSQAIAEKRAQQADLQAKAAALCNHPCDRKDLEVALAGLVDALQAEAEARFAKHLAKISGAPNPENSQQFLDLVLMHMRHPQWHATEFPELAALALPQLLREAIPSWAARMAERTGAFPQSELSHADRLVRYRALDAEAQRVSEETEELLRQAKEAGLAV